MQDQELNQLATQMVSQLKSMDNFKAMHKLMLQQFINNSLEAEMRNEWASRLRQTS